MTNKQKFIYKAKELGYFIILMAGFFLMGTGLTFLDGVSQ